MKLAMIIFFIVISTGSYAKSIVIGTSRFNPPFEMWTSHNTVAYGYDIEVMSEICDRLDMDCTFEPYTFDELFYLVNSQKVDLAVASIIISPERQKHFLFSLPYLESSTQYITNIDSPINSKADLYGKKIGVRNGTPYGKFVLSQNQNNKLVGYSEVDDMLIGLQKKEIDACILDYESADYWVAANSTIYKLVGEKMLIGEGYAIMVSKNSAELIQSINKTLVDMQNDGTFIRFYSQYF